jgi:quinoprotein glucose dehydrogenase
MTRFGPRALWAALLLLASACGGPSVDAAADVEWPHYANDAGGTKYSPLAQIDRGNVSRLRVAWTARAGDFPPETFEPTTHGDSGLPDDARSVGACAACHGSEVKFETTPIMRGGTLFVSTPLNRVLALDARTGAERWAFDPMIDQDREYSEGFVSRGVSAWDDPDASGGTCARRVFLATLDARLIALDAGTGTPCQDFGTAGTVDLGDGVAINGRDVDEGQYEVTSPPAILRGLVIVGSAIGDNRRRDVESGVVRAYDARTGELRWSFDPIPRDAGHPAAGGWSEAAMRATGAANVWSIISTDPERDLVFLPTGSPAPDFYGGERPGRNDYANSVVALRGATGEVVWSFQVVHHDLWDFDVPAQPVLIDVDRDGASVPAVAVGTKMGHVFVLHRETGEPLLPVEERPVPASDVPGERSWPTQPFPVLPPPLHSTTLTPDDAWGPTDADRAFCRDWISRLRNDGIFTPPSLDPILMWPGFAGGMSWDGMAWDPERRMLVTSVKHLAMFLQLHPRSEYETIDRVEGRQYTGQGGTPYGMSRQPLVSPSGLPCNPPPFGTLVAVDLGAGSIRWETPVGRIPGFESVPGSQAWGSLVFGGPLVTGGGLTFIAAGQDDRMRAFDTESGELLWEHALPAGGQAAPMTYSVDGRQLVIIVAGGRGGIGSPGDYIVAFALP